MAHKQSYAIQPYTATQPSLSRATRFPRLRDTQLIWGPHHWPL